jgi:TPR repeat protein
MKLTLKHVLAAILLALSFIAPVAADPIEDAVAAMKRDDWATAMRLLRPLADQGDPAAQFYMGKLYYVGGGGSASNVEAVKWYRKAADQGHPIAQYDLGYAYEKGVGVLQDFVSAHMWLNLAAAGGQRSAADERDEVEKRMTPAQIAEAQKLASEWKPTKQPPPH